MAGYVIYFSFRECKYYVTLSQDASDHQSYYGFKAPGIPATITGFGGKMHNLYPQNHTFW